MTVLTPTADATPQRRRLSPDAGWLPLLLLLGLAFLTGRAIDDAKWVPGPESLTDFLPWTAMCGVLVGFATSILGWGRFRSALAGALVAAIIVPFLVGVAILPRDADVFARYEAAAKAAVEATIDLILLGRGSTTQFGHSLLLFGFLLWGTGQFAAVAVYRYGRAMPACVALGTFLIINVSLTPQSQLSYLVAYSVIALLLLVRMHAVDERREWLRRRIGDPAPLAALTLRGGTVFVALAIFGSLALTTAAHSKPLQAVWEDIGVQDSLVDLGRTLQRYVPFVSNPRGPAGVDFGPNAQIGLSWTADHAIAVHIQRDPRDPISYYWKAASYDLFDGSGWTASDGGQVDRAPGAPLLDGTTEATVRPGWHEISVTVVPDSFNGSQALSPGRPTSADVDTKVTLDEDHGFVTSVVVPRGEPYAISGVVPVTDVDDDASLTQSKLRAAGVDYLSELTKEQIDRYTTIPVGAIGPKANEILEAVVARSPSQTPYDIAVTMKDYLSDSDNFTYSSDITSVQCGDLGVVECFATFKQGFCQYYATTMAILMRSLDIPTRFVQGFLPGTRSIEGVETVENAGSHAWVEVWFPGYGWYMFDPTGGGLNVSAPILPPGENIPIPSISPRPSLGPELPDPSRNIQNVPGTTTAPSAGGLPGPGPFIAIGLLLAIAVGGLAFVSYRKGPREVTPESAWGSVTGIARRLGFGPRPTQTIYEYSSALGDILPSARPELETVAQAKVEVAYGHRVLSPARVDAVKAATARLRIRLLRLVLRPRRRR